MTSLGIVPLLTSQFANIYYSDPLTPDCMTDLIVNSGVQDALEDHPVAADFYDALDEEVAELIEEASRRAEANDRKTVMPQDL